ncbi:hypothetical protein MTO96_018149 [Rhipicephalus appendiculatus]
MHSTMPIYNHNNPDEETSVAALQSGRCDDSGQRFRESNAQRLRFPDDCDACDHISANREEKNSYMPSWPETEGAPQYLSSDTESTGSSAINDQPAFVNSSVDTEDDDAARSSDDRAPSPRSPEAVSDQPTRDSLPLYAATGSRSRAGSSGPMCRICHEGDQKDQLESPCSCSGTIGFMHASCLEHWLTERNVNFCEVCGDRFQMVTQPLTMLRFFRWVSHNKGRLSRECLCDLFGILAVEILLFVCVFYVLARLVLKLDCVAWGVVFLYVINIS